MNETKNSIFTQWSSSFASNFPSLLKAGSECIVSTTSFLGPNTRLHSTICSSKGRCWAIWKNLVAFLEVRVEEKEEAKASAPTVKRPSQMKITKAKRSLMKVSRISGSSLSRWRAVKGSKSKEPIMSAIKGPLCFILENSSSDSWSFWLWFLDNELFQQQSCCSKQQCRQWTWSWCQLHVLKPR